MYKTVVRGIIPFTVGILTFCINNKLLAITLQSDQKLNLISSFVVGDNQSSLYNFLKGTNPTKSTGTGTSSLNTLSFQTSGEIDNIDFATTYLFMFNPANDTVDWMMNGTYNNSNNWSSSGLATFLDNNETIILDNLTSINPDVDGVFMFGREGDKWVIRGRATGLDDLGGISEDINIFGTATSQTEEDDVMSEVILDTTYVDPVVSNLLNRIFTNVSVNTGSDSNVVIEATSEKKQSEPTATIGILTLAFAGLLSKKKKSRNQIG